MHSRQAGRGQCLEPGHARSNHEQSRSTNDNSSQWGYQVSQEALQLVVLTCLRSFDRACVKQQDSTRFLLFYQHLFWRVARDRSACMAEVNQLPY